MRRRCPSGAELCAWLDGELSWSRRRRIEDHVEGCPFCADQVAALEQVRRVVGNLDQLAPVALDTGVTVARTWRRLRVALTEDRVRVRWRRIMVHPTPVRPSVWWGAGSLAGALAIFLFVVGSRVFSQWPQVVPGMARRGAVATAEDGLRPEARLLGVHRSSPVGSLAGDGTGAGQWLVGGRQVADTLAAGPSHARGGSDSGNPAADNEGRLVLNGWVSGATERAGAAGVDYPQLQAVAVTPERDSRRQPADRGVANVPSRQNPSGATQRELGATAADVPVRGRAGSATTGEGPTVTAASWHPPVSNATNVDAGARTSASRMPATAAVTPTSELARTLAAPEQAGPSVQSAGETDQRDRASQFDATAPSREPSTPPAWQPLKEDHQAYAQQQGTLSADQVEAAVVQMAVMAAASVPVDGSAQSPSAGQ